jgi:plasmid stabilization system protein ParE
MAKVIWSPSSLDDIDTIAKFISKDSVYHASLFIDRLFIYLGTDYLFPFIGRSQSSDEP